MFLGEKSAVGDGTVMCMHKYEANVYYWKGERLKLCIRYNYLS